MSCTGLQAINPICRHGDLVDTMRDRIILPVTTPQGRIRGFIGRDTTGDVQAPKYRNPTRTATFDKAAVLYRPTHHQLADDGNVVVVEGVLDALAIAAVAARTGQTARFAPCTTSGVAVSQAQVDAVLALHTGPPVLALDGDHAGAEGTDRWLDAVCFERHRPALVTRLPHGADPADWLAFHGDVAVRAFDAHPGTDQLQVAPRPPGRPIVRRSIPRGGDPIHYAAAEVATLAAQLPSATARELIESAISEMTSRGWNPDGAFNRTLHAEFQSAGQQQQRSWAAQPGLREEVVHRIGPGASPSLI